MFLAAGWIDIQSSENLLISLSTLLTKTINFSIKWNQNFPQKLQVCIETSGELQSLQLAAHSVLVVSSHSTTEISLWLQSLGPLPTHQKALPSLQLSKHNRLLSPKKFPCEPAAASRCLICIAQTNQSRGILHRFERGKSIKTARELFASESSLCINNWARRESRAELQAARSGGRDETTKGFAPIISFTQINTVTVSRCETWPRPSPTCYTLGFTSFSLSSRLEVASFSFPSLCALPSRPSRFAASLSVSFEAESTGTGISRRI